MRMVKNRIFGHNLIIYVKSKAINSINMSSFEHCCMDSSDYSEKKIYVYSVYCIYLNLYIDMVGLREQVIGSVYNNKKNKLKTKNLKT